MRDVDSPWLKVVLDTGNFNFRPDPYAELAALAPPHLTSIVPIDFTDDRYTDDCHYRGGLLRMYYDIGWYGTRMIACVAKPRAEFCRMGIPNAAVLPVPVRA